MKAIEKVSIAGISFSIEQDAYIRLNNYLQALEAKYSLTPEGREIIADIEARIAEIILESLKDSSVVVTLPIIEKVISQLGMPDSEEGETSPRIPRRLYRNTEGSRLGGVLNGLATYFDMNVGMLRLAGLAAFAISIFWWHSMIVPIVIGYIIAWVAIPAAKTARQKLEMRGEVINASTLEQNIRNEIQNMSNSSLSEHDERSASIFARLIYGIGRFMLICLKVFAMFLGFILSLVAIVIVVACVGVAMEGTSVISVLSDIAPWKAILIGGVVALIPIIIIIWLILKLVFDLRGGKWFVITAASLWVLAAIAAGIVSVRGVRDFKSKVEYTETRSLNYTADTLYVQYADKHLKNYLNFNNNNNFFSGDLADMEGYTVRTKIYIADGDAPDSVFMMDITRRSRGSSVSDARKNADVANPEYQIKGDVLYINPTVVTDSNNKWRDQKIDLYIQIPKGKELIFINDDAEYNKYKEKVVVKEVSRDGISAKIKDSAGQKEITIKVSKDN